jgi:hypothetical protein
VSDHGYKYSDFENFRDDLYNANMVLPRPEMKPKELLESGDDGYPGVFSGKPISHFLFQCLTVQDYQGKTVEKGDNTTDDIFRACVLAHSFLVDEDFMEYFEGLCNANSHARSSMGVLLNAANGATGSGATGSSNVGSRGSTSSTASTGGGPRVFVRGR